jgi:hypothetical protein
MRVAILDEICNGIMRVFGIWDLGIALLKELRKARRVYHMGGSFGYGRLDDIHSFILVQIYSVQPLG